MLAFEILINGKKVATIGQEDMSILSTTIVASQGNQTGNVGNYVRLSLGGMSHELPEGFSQHFRWGNRNLSTGDRVELNVIETSHIDQPTKRYRSDSKIQESPFTDQEMKAMRYEDYLELRKEFETSGGA